MTDLPAPPVPPECDLQELQWMPLDVRRLRDSDLSGQDAEVFRVAVLSWCASLHQVPAASLPDDDAALARLLGFGRDVRGWQKVRAAGGLRGWKLHADGRLYHAVVAAKALEAAEQQQRSAAKRERDAERLKKWRESQESRPVETRDETRFTTRYNTRDETRYVAEIPDQTLPNQTKPDQTVSTPPPSSGESARDGNPAASGDGGEEPTGPGTPGADAPGTPRTLADGLRARARGYNPDEIRRGLAGQDLCGILRGFRCSLAPGRISEWERDAGGQQLGALVAILWRAASERHPVREPSGFRAALVEWEQLSLGLRRDIVQKACADLGIVPQTQPQPAGAA